MRGESGAGTRAQSKAGCACEIYPAPIEEEVIAMRKTPPVKLSSAALLRERTTMPAKRIAERLKMGHPSNVTMAVRLNRTDRSKTKQTLGNAMECALTPESMPPPHPGENQQ